MEVGASHDTSLNPDSGIGIPSLVKAENKTEFGNFECPFHSGKA